MRSMSWRKVRDYEKRYFIDIIYYSHLHVTLPNRVSRFISSSNFKLPFLCEFFMTVFITKKTTFHRFMLILKKQFGLKFTWQMYLQHLTLRSKFGSILVPVGR
jgi:hypothetical protein